ncbi:MAG: aminodeoxychorismate synthase component I [Pseudohongiellaceae bacterium]
MSDFTAIISTEDGAGWQRFSRPVAVVTARRPGEVVPALKQVEAYAAKGLTAIGYVAYEAAPAFDSSLKCRHHNGALLKFAVFSESQAWEPPGTPLPNLALASEIGKPDYLAAVDDIKRYLRDGDSYQVNFTQRLIGHCAADPETLFAALLTAQPSPLACFLQDETEAVCSVSPELFFSLDNEHIMMEPMKGTRPRGSDAASEQRMQRELLDSEKERAENLMIVDMVRNDLGRIVAPGSVKVDALFELRSLPTVWQQVSRISATTSASLPELFSALFPCASITGAPKARTMEIIEQLEVSPRGVYTGAVGVVRPGRSMRFNVGIRTLTVDRHRKVAEYGIGGGIVWDSEPVAEWQEARVKARVLDSGNSDWQLLETLVYDPDSGVALRREHLDRLAGSARHFGFILDLDAVKQTLDDYQADRPMKLRLLLERDGQFRLEDSKIPDSKSVVSLGIAVSPVCSRDNFLRHKTTQRQVYQYALQQVADVDDVILWNEREELTETTIYNLFLDIEGALLTPPISAGLLPGTFRRHLLDSGQATESVLYKDDLVRASRILVGNSVRGLREARLVDSPVGQPTSSRPRARAGSNR